jgi:L-cysteine:1D-myo-inositol 2-amino-2-deoxy-alpha-D-glucopyranoside ligase
VPTLPGRGTAPHLHNGLQPPIAVSGPSARLYVCGITPYDTTHLGHAATYLAFDTLVRAWRDAGISVSYGQNVTDVDDPLLERATATGVDWRELAASQVEQFREDMQSLSIVPPDHFVGVTEAIDPVAAAVGRLLESGEAYLLGLETGMGNDIYFDSAASSGPWSLGEVSSMGRAEMLLLSAARGGDPDRVGKRDALDPLLWRAAREGEPSWESVVGSGRPGWHIECSVIAQDFVGVPLSVNGGGSDLTFPHHEFSAAHTSALTGEPLAALHAHTGMVALQGEKMSKSLGNLVRVSELVEEGTDPRAIRLALLANHYRADWEWTPELLVAAEQRLASWLSWAEGQSSETTLLPALRTAIADDLGTPTALNLVDERVASDVSPSRVELNAIQALLGIQL